MLFFGSCRIKLIIKLSIASLERTVQTTQAYGVGSLSLLQWIFPTQKSNQGLAHGW